MGAMVKSLERGAPAPELPTKWPVSIKGKMDLVDAPLSRLSFPPVDRLKERMPSTKSEVLQGTLDLLVLKTLDSMGPMHGFGIAQRIQQVSEDLLQLNQGTLYPALLRLEQRGWIVSKWGVSENNRKAKYYSLTRTGRKQLEEEAESWGRMSAMINRVLRTG
jgi:PadR family transcriptional regulator PadR